MDEFPDDRIIFNWFNFLTCLNLNLLLDPSIRHFGTLPRFVMGSDILGRTLRGISSFMFYLVAFVHAQSVPALAHRHEKMPLLTLV